MTDTDIYLMFETLEACPVCGSADFALCYTRNHYGVDCHYQECAGCGTMFLSPRLSDEQTEAYYRGTYRSIMNGLGSIDNPDYKTQENRARVQVGICGEMLKGCRTNLEIGCSAGYLMRELRDQLGMMCIGIEPDERYHAMEPAHQFTIYPDLSRLGRKQFDLITMSHVLEHINHPVEYLRGLIGLHAKPETLFMVEVPNAAATVNAYLIHHPIAYTLETLVGLFGRVGYQPVQMFYHGLGTPINNYILGVFQKA